MSIFTLVRASANQRRAVKQARHKIIEASGLVRLAEQHDFAHELDLLATRLNIWLFEDKRHNGPSRPSDQS